VKVIADRRTSEQQQEIIEISIPCPVDLIVLARFAAATIGARAGFDLDEIDDLRLAVDELSVSFGPLNRETCLRFEFLRESDTVTVRCTHEPTLDLNNGSGDAEFDVINWEQARELSQQLLHELVDVFGHEVKNGRSVAWLKKQRGASSR
jgi:hypothetical protein